MFLRRIVPGGADRSYGVHVAKLAGLPGSVINRAWEVLRVLEDGGGDVDSTAESGPHRRRGADPVQQLPLLAASSSAVQALMELDVASMTPLEAITKLYELQEQARDT